ncbi:MAG: amidohydrolase [Clostridia bacterium]|nr:amidohydrolase [Clostridia bacterium]
MKKAAYILKSNNIYRGTGMDTFPGIVAVRDDKIIFVGDTQREKDFTDEHTEIMDFGDKLIMPGMHDAHLHFFMSGLYADPKVKVSSTDRSEQECVDGLRDIENLVGKDEWMLGAGWNHTEWDNPVLPTKHSLDKAYPDRPVAMISADCHTVWMNSKGLEKIGVDRNTPDISGGFMDRDENGEPLGVFHEAAATSLYRVLFDFPEEESERFYLNFMKILNSYGITSVCDMSIMAVPGLDFVRDDIYEKLEKEGKLSVRVHMFPTMEPGLERAMEMRDRFQGPMLYCNGVKHFFDGVSGCHTAYLKEPYSNAYFPGDCGKTTVPPDDMRRMLLEAHENDFSMRVHTIGDEAIHLMIDYAEEAETKFGHKPWLHHTLEHLENFQFDDIERLQRAHLIASVQPAHILLTVSGVERDLGYERNQLMWPFRRLIDSGVRIAFGTDSPVVDVNPLHSIYNAVTRQSAFDGSPAGGWIPREKIAPWEAVSAYTYGSACAANAEHLYGTLAPGMFADICVLDHNIIKEDPENILETYCVMTMCGGKIVYDNSEFGVRSSE